jgi:hypothetical protein
LLRHASDAKGQQVTNCLLDRVFEAATQPDASDRRLTAVDLHRSIEVAATPVLALQSAARTASATTDHPEGLLISSVAPPIGNIASRGDAVSTILERTRGDPMIWLYGTRGVGNQRWLA